MIKQPLTLFLLFFFSFVNAQNIALKQELKALLDKKNDSSYLNTFLENANNKNTNAIDKIEYQAAYVNLLVALAKYDKAMQFSKENLAKYEKENLPYGKAIFNNLVAICYYYLTNRKEAIFYFLKSYDLCKQFGFIESQSLLANNLGAMSIEENDYPLAKKYLIESRNLFQKHHEKLKNYGGITLRLLGQVYEHENDLIAAEKIYDEVHVYCTNIKDSSGLAINYGCLSRIYMKTNRAAKAFETNKLSLKCADALNKRDIVIATRQMYIENLEKAGNFKQALYFQKQIDTLTQKYFTQETKKK